MRKILLILITFTFSGYAFSQTQTSLVGFQNIPWGSSIDVIRTKFPEVKVKDLCKSVSSNEVEYQDFKKSLNSENASCTYLTIDKYGIEGIDYRVEFSLNKQSRLEYVSLIFQRRQLDGENYINECNAAFEKTSRLLGLRYGEGFIPANVSDFAKEFSTYTALGWVSLPTEIWIANLSGHRFSKELANISSDKTAKRDYCMVKVKYTKRVPNGASKL